MKRIEKLKAFSKRLLLHIAVQAIPGPAQLLYEIAQDFYQIFMVADDADRQALIEAACEMTDAERSSLIRDLSQQFGQAQAQAIEGVLSTLRVRPQTHNALQRINQTMLSSSRQTLQPMVFSARQRAIGSAVASSMLMPSQAHQGRAVHPSRWPHIDGFEIKNFLGQGSFAEVYLAHELNAQGEFKRSCALKVGDLKDIKRFNREVNALQHVQHENLIDYYGSGILQDSPPPRFWIAMPNLSGITLGDLMRGGLDVEQKLMLSMQVSAGLRALHEKKLSHRDLKPENALITEDFTLKLTDFGLSKSDGQEDHASLLTMGGDMLGTPAYMSPEQVKGVKSGMESDVWAFGVILYELFVGTLPFIGNVGEILGKIQYETIQWNHQKIPKQLKSVMQKCLDQDLSRRYASAIELSTEFMPKAEQWRTALRHERFRGSWTQVFEQDLFVRFAEEHQGLLPVNASQVFVSTFPELPELDEERLDEVLPAVFSAYQALLHTRQELSEAGKDCDRLIEQVEQAAVDTLGLKSMNQAIARAVDVGEVKAKAKWEVLTYEQRQSELRQRVREAEVRVPRVAQEILREELSDYQSLLAEREGIKNIHVDTYGAHMRICHRWFSAEVILMIIFIIIWDVWLVGWYYDSRGVIGESDESFFIEALSIVFNYLTLAFCLNKTYLLIDQQNLKITHKPLPWKGNYLIPLKTITQFYCKEHIIRSKNGSTRIYSLNYIDEHKRHHKILTNISKPSEVQYLEKVLELHLGIINRQVSGEFQGGEQLNKKFKDELETQIISEHKNDYGEWGIYFKEPILKIYGNEGNLTLINKDHQKIIEVSFKDPEDEALKPNDLLAGNNDELTLISLFETFTFFLNQALLSIKSPYGYDNQELMYLQKNKISGQYQVFKFGYQFVQEVRMLFFYLKLSSDSEKQQPNVSIALNSLEDHYKTSRVYSNAVASDLKFYTSFISELHDLLINKIKLFKKSNTLNKSHLYDEYALSKYKVFIDSFSSLSLKITPHNLDEVQNDLLQLQQESIDFIEKYYAEKQKDKGGKGDKEKKELF